MDYIMETVGLRKAYKDNIVVDDVKSKCFSPASAGRITTISSALCTSE